MTYEDEYSFCRPYLATGEYILWKGKPGKGNLLTRNDLYMIPFSILWFGFALFWEAGVIKSGNILFMIFGIPFVCVGLYITIGRFFWTAYIRRKTLYVITNKKIIRSRARKIDMLYANSLRSVRIEMYKNGNGTLHFGGTNSYENWGGMRKNVVFDNSGFRLENIPDIIKVQQHIGNMEK